MPKLNFYDTDAVKAFVLNILVENEDFAGTWTSISVSPRPPGRTTRPKRRAQTPPK